MSRRTPQREMEAWKRRVSVLLAKEARCPGCVKARRLNDGTLEPVICPQHQRVRQAMALTYRRRSYGNG